MIALKWKLYRISNYLLLIAGAFLVIKFIEIGIFLTEPGFELYSFFMVLMFLLMIIQSTINLFVMAKTFPNKLLIRGKFYWQIFSIICNSIVFLALSYLTFFELLADSDNRPLNIAFIFLFLIVNSAFVLYSQLGLKRFLHGKNATPSNL